MGEEKKATFKEKVKGKRYLYPSCQSYDRMFLSTQTIRVLSLVLLYLFRAVAMTYDLTSNRL